MKRMLFAANRMPPPQQNSLTPKLLAVLVAACMPLPTLAMQYQGPLNADGLDNSAFESIKSGSAEEGYVYTFQNGDEIVSTNSVNNFVVGGSSGKDLTLKGNILVQGSVSGDAPTQMLNGLYVWVTDEADLYTLQTGNLSIDVQTEGTSTSGTQWVNAHGIYNVWGETETGTIDVTTHAVGNNAYAATAQGVIVKNGGSASIAGGTIEAVAENDGYATQAFGVNAETHNERANTISSSEELKISVHAVNRSDNASSFAAAYGIQNKQTSTAPHNVITLSKTDIIALAETVTGSAEAIGIYTGESAQTVVGEGIVDATATSTDGQGLAYGLYSDVGAEKIIKGAGNITAKGSSFAAGIFAVDGEVEYGGGTISASMISEELVPNSTGIHVEDSATVSLVGNTEVSGASALVGSGTVIVNKSVSVGFNGEYDQFTGNHIVCGTSGLGMSMLEAEGYTSDKDAAALVLYAGAALDGHYVVGTQAQAGSSSTSSGSSLTLLGDATLVVVASDNYQSQSALVTVDVATSEPTSVVRLVNSARVEDGTIIFDTQDDASFPEEFIFETDNLLTEAVSNRIVKKSAQSVFDSELLIPNTVDSALSGVAGVGADRIIGLTSDRLTVETSAQALNKIALMGAGSGAQIAASNAAILIDESLMRHGSKLAALSHEPGRTDLWLDLNGSFSRADNFKSGSTSYGFKSDLAGATFGADHSFSNNVVVGAALSFGTGSVRGQDTAAGTKNEVDYWGISLYGAWDAGLVNVIGSVGWLQTKNDIYQSGFGGEPDVSAFSISTRIEKPFEVGDGYSITPHVGVRWVHIDMDDFTAGGFDYRSETLDLISIPIGFAVSNKFATAGNITLKPYLDLEVAPILGDKETDNKVGIVGSAVEDVINTRIASSVIYSARLGISGSIGDVHELGLYYGVSAGNGQYVSQQLKAGYRFVF